MARILPHHNKTYLKCGDCQVVFPHDKSSSAGLYVDVMKKEQEMWESPCCGRRYSLIGFETDDELSGVITHGWSTKKARNKYANLNSEGIGWPD